MPFHYTSLAEGLKRAVERFNESDYSKLHKSTVLFENCGSSPSENEDPVDYYALLAIL